jgi:lipopolysaccharide/colanic/teichoic acid biosynthesis glycosyltransferase
VGLSPAALELADHLRKHPELGTFPVGYISDDQPEGGAGLKRLGGFADLDDVIAREEPRGLVIARREEVLPTWTGEFLELDFGGVGIEEAGTLYERTFGRVSAPEVWPPRFVVSDIFEPDEAASRLQSIYSPVLAAVALVLCSPVMIFTALLIRLTSGTPVLERQMRAGQHGLPFPLYSFRTEGVPGGDLLTRWGVAHWPWLLSVLRGDMALVGPAPERPEYVEQLGRRIPFYAQRCRVKPGLTGWEQVHRSQFPQRDTLRQLEYDLYYVKNLAPSLDSAVLLLALKEKLL